MESNKLNSPGKKNIKQSEDFTQDIPKEKEEITKEIKDEKVNISNLEINKVNVVEPHISSLNRLTDVDLITSLVKTRLDEVRKIEEARLQQDKSVQTLISLNEWNVKLGLKEKNQVKIVKNIPTILAFRRKGIDELSSQYLKQILPSQVTEVQLIKDSMETFCSGTDEVRYIIDAKNTFEPLLYDPEAPPHPSLEIKSIITSPFDLGNSRTNVYASLLELILRLRKQGDVFILNPPSVRITKYSKNENLDVIQGRKIYDGGLPNIYIGVFNHSLLWFRQDVNEKLDETDVRFGIVGKGDMMYTGRDKKNEYAAVSTDHIFATLHTLYMNQQANRRSDAFSYTNALELLKPHNSSLTVVNDNERDMYEIYKLDITDAHSYLFGFILSPAVRSTQYAYLLEYLKNMRGIREISATDRLMTSVNIIELQNVKSEIQAEIKNHIRGYTIDHWYQMMVMELSHSFIEPTSSFNRIINTIQDALITLFSITLDALCFPNLFWTNIHIYGYIIYLIWNYAATNEYDQMMRNGYTQNNKELIQLTKNQLRSGEIPRIFENQRNLPPFIRRWLGIILPVGEIIEPPIVKADWAPFIKRRQHRFYNPFKKCERDRIGSAKINPFFTRIRSLTLLINDMATKFGKSMSQSMTITGQLTSTLRGIGEFGKVFGAICHHELHLLYLNLANGPEIIDTQFRGQTIPSIYNSLGLCSSTEGSTNFVRAEDDVERLFVGIGLWGMMSIIGDQIDVAGCISVEKDSSFQFSSPTLRYEHHELMVHKCKTVAEAFGIMTEVIRRNDDPLSKFSFLRKEFGLSLGSGSSNKVLQWLLPDIDLKKFIHGDAVTSVDSALHDLRFTGPKICRISEMGIILPLNRDDYEIFNDPLILLDNFELQKLNVCAEIVASMGSPIHRYGRGLVVQKSSFQYISPENLHSDDFIDFNYESNVDSFKYMVIDGNLKVCFHYNDEWFHGTFQHNFPANIRLVIKNPHLVIPEFWQLFESALEAKKWQLFFPNVQYLARIERVTVDQASQLNPSEPHRWKILKTIKSGEVIEWTFYDTSINMLNIKYQVTPSGCEQYVCACEPIDRNVIVKGICGLAKQPGYVSPNYSSWTLGEFAEGNLPRYKNGLDKYQCGDANFNNVLKIYTGDVKIDEKPKVIFTPPSGDQL